MKILLTGATLLTTLSVFACENPFVYNELPEVPIQGECGVEQFITQSLGRDLGAGYNGKYRGLEFETEIDFGISTRDQLKLSIGHAMVHGSDINAFRFTGAQLGYLHVFADAEKDDWGWATFTAFGFNQVEATSGAIERSTHAELAIFGQRNFGAENRWSYVVNLGGEFSRVNETHETAVEYTLSQGIAYSIDSEWTGCLEAVGRAEYLEGKAFEWSGLFLGPTITYNQKTVAFSLGVLAQIVGNPGEKGRLNVSHASPLEVRLKLGFEF